MDEYFAYLPAGNATVICVGGVTRKEAEAARDDGLDIDGVGYYLFTAKESDPHEPIEILAKFLSQNQAAHFAKLITRQAA